MSARAADSQETMDDTVRDDTIDRVVSETIAFIKHRGYVAGERLPSERDLAGRFAVSRGAVREALTKLQAMRVIERRASSGIYLGREPGATSVEALVLTHDLGIPLEEKDIHESMEVRRILEVQAIRLACERRADTDLESLDGVLAATEAEIGAVRMIADLDYHFHMAIFRATQNMIFVRVVNPFYLLSRSRRDAFFQDAERARISHAQHVAIVDAIRRRDAEAGATLMANHIGRVENLYLGRSGSGRP
jgi:DNA-binding FadR family transcriptional regulator